KAVHQSRKIFYIVFFFSSRRRHTRSKRDWSSDVCSSDLVSATMDGLGSTFYLKRQLMWFVLSLIVFGLTALFPYQKYRRYLKIRSEERRVGKECRYQCAWYK